MITRITIPQAFENMEEATIGQWLKHQGDAVAPGDELCELITEKTTFPLEAEAEGVLRLVVANEKSIVPVGAIIGIIADENEALPDIETENLALRADATDTKNASSAPIPAPVVAAPRMSTHVAHIAGESAASGARVRATPAARRAAKERGLSLEDVALTLPGKVLSEDDVNNFGK